MIEDMESDMRSNLNQLYILKTREVVNSLRNNAHQEGAAAMQAASHVSMLNAAVMGRGRKTSETNEEKASV
jgi:hypothetical protein